MKAFRVVRDKKWHFEYESDKMHRTLLAADIRSQWCGTIETPEGVAYRWFQPEEGESLWDRNPEDDGFENIRKYGARKPGREAKYPIEEWLKGEWVLARGGVDFTCSVVSFHAYLRTLSSQNGKILTAKKFRPENNPFHLGEHTVLFCMATGRKRPIAEGLTATYNQQAAQRADRMTPEERELDRALNGQRMKVFLAEQALSDAAETLRQMEAEFRRTVERGAAT